MIDQGLAFVPFQSSTSSSMLVSVEQIDQARHLVISELPCLTIDHFSDSNANALDVVQ
jgi:hypothetical protein